MGNPQGTGLPGVRADRTATPRKILISDVGAVFLPAGRVIVGADSRDPLNTGDLDVLRSGLLMGMNSTSKKFAPSIIGLTTVAYDASGSSNTSLTVSAATAVEINRRVGSSGTLTIRGAPTATGVVATETVTYSAINVTTGVLTISTLGADYVAGSLIGDTDGTQVPRGILVNDYGIKVTDQDAASQDTQLDLLCVGGQIDSSQVINWPAAANTTLIAWVKEQLRAYGMGYLFDDDYL